MKGNGSLNSLLKALHFAGIQQDEYFLLLQFLSNCLFLRCSEFLLLYMTSHN